ncbi:MAG: hypothetical protein NW226_14660 [Microscillaceae bacterium]|nr:hypothetical protein [Microscillaceae bacterium]
MADLMFEDKSKIEEILATSSRLKYLVTQEYGIKPDEILYVRVDGDNFKVDIETHMAMYRFKAQDTEHVLLKDAETGVMKKEFDPALAQGIYEIVHDFAQE